MNRPLSDNLQNHAECPGMDWEEQMLAYFQQQDDDAPQLQLPQRDQTVSYHVKCITFDCISCGKTLTLEKRTPASIASGVFCLCGQSRQYYINWNEMVLKLIETPAPKEQVL